MMNSKAWAVAAALTVTGAAQAACYSVHRADGSLILETSTTPVNLTLPLGDTVPEKFGPGTFMTISDLGVFCKERHAAPAAQKVVAAAAPAKKRGAMKAAALVEAAAPVEQQPSDEELLALKPDEVASVLPVQGVDVTGAQAAKPMPDGEGGNAQQQVDARQAAGNVGVQQE
jgi:hypothetical protein